MRVPYFNLDILFRCFILSKLFFCISLLTKFENLMPLKMKTVCVEETAQEEKVSLSEKPLL